MSGWKERVSRGLVEVVSVVFAVLIALTADQWAEDREKQRRADRALAAVVAEIERNVEALSDADALDNDALEADLQRAMADDSFRDFDLNYEFIVVNDAAWQAAQMSQATLHMDIALVIELAELYQVQELFMTNQQAVVDVFGRVGELIGPDGLEVSPIAGRVGVANQLRTQVVEAAELALEWITNGGPPEGDSEDSDEG